MMVTLRRLRTAGIAALIALSSSMAYSQDVDALLGDGIQSYKEGNYAEAKIAFEKALSQRPSSDAIFTWVESVTVAQIVRMASEKDPELAGYARALLQGARVHRREMRDDAELIARAVEDTLDAEGEDQIKLMITHSADFGRNLTPALIDVLGDSEISRRTTAFSWIATYIGRDAIPALVPAWKHSNEVIRTNVAKLLGVSRMRHPYSLAYLKAMSEMDESGETKAAAQASISAILRGSGGSGDTSDARVLFLRNANKLYSDPYSNDFDKSEYASAVFELKGDKVTPVRVARFQVSERMASQNLREALAINPSSPTARALNLLNDSAQVLEYDSNSAWYQSQDGFDGVKQILESQKGYVDSVLRMQTVSASTAILAKALEMAGGDTGRSEVFEFVIDRYRDRMSHGAVPAALIDALEDENSRLVRIGAAISLAEMSPTEGFDAGAQVVGHLEDAVKQSGIRTVVRAMGSQENANRFGQIVEAAHMESHFHVGTTSDAYGTITRLPPDLVLVDDQLKLDINGRGVESVSVFLNNLRRDYRTAQVPVVVVVAPEKLESMKGIHESADKRVWVVPSNIDGLQFRKSVVDPIFEGRDDVKARATQVAALAAKALHGLAEAGNPAFPVAAAVDSLKEVLANRPDAVRIPCIEALGALGADAASAVATLAQAYANDSNEVPVRVAALMAVGRILSSDKVNGVNSAVASIILDGTKSSDLALRKAAFVAFADAGLDDKYLDLLDVAVAGGSAGGDAGLGDDDDDDAGLGDDDDDDDAGLGDDDDDDDDEGFGDDDDEGFGDDDDDDL